MTSVRIGRSATTFDWRRHDRFLDYLELDVEDGNWPKRSRLTEWRKEARANFEFGISLPVSLVETAEVDEATLARLDEVAAVLEPRWLVLRTPTQFRPTNASRQRLISLFERFKRDGVRVAWQARGLWEPEEAQKFAQENAVSLVADPTEAKLELDETCCYCRVSQISTQGRLRTAHAESIAERLFEHPDAYLVLPGRGAVTAARLVRQSLAWFGGDES